MVLGYYPKDWKEATVVDMISETFGDVFNLWSSAALSGKAEDEIAQKFTDSLGENGPATKFFKVVEKQLEKGGGKFIIGNTVTMADFCLSALIFDYIMNKQNPVSAKIDPIIR